MFKVINEEFVCQNCGHHNQKLPGSCRNHCTECLYSLHLDQDSPGDRLSNCHGLMKPLSVYQNKKKGWMILHHCLNCNKEIPNKTAPEDNFDLIIRLTKPHPPYA